MTLHSLVMMSKTFYAIPTSYLRGIGYTATLCPIAVNRKQHMLPFDALRIKAVVA